MNEIHIRFASEAAPSARPPVTAIPVVAVKEVSAVKEAAPLSEATAMPTSSGNALPPEDKQASQDAAAVSASVERLTDRIQSLRRELLFSVDDDSGRTVITVRDAETDQVIRQIPAEEVLRLARRLEESQDDAVKGLLLAGQA